MALDAIQDGRVVAATQQDGYLRKGELPLRPDFIRRLLPRPDEKWLPGGAPYGLDCDVVLLCDAVQDCVGVVDEEQVGGRARRVGDDDVGLRPDHDWLRLAVGFTRVIEAGFDRLVVLMQLLQRHHACFPIINA